MSVKDRVGGKGIELRAQIMGTLTATIQGRSIVPTASKPRQLLAMLLAAAPEVCSVEAITEELWEDTAPRSAVTTMQTYVMQIRREIARALGGAEAAHEAKRILVKRHGGYALEVDFEFFDLHEFTHSYRRGLRALEEQDAHLAAEELGRCTELWGPGLLHGVRTGPRLDAVSVRIREEAGRAAIGRITADLMLGRHEEVLGELVLLVKENPMDESASERFMVAAYRSGQVHRALEEFARLRRTLVAELGLEPGGRLRGLQARMIAGEQDLLVAPRSAETPVGAW